MSERLFQQPASFTDPPMYFDAPCRHCGKMREEHRELCSLICIGVVDKWGDAYEYEPVTDEDEDADREYEREWGE